MKQEKGKLDAYHFCAEMSEGILNRLVRAQLSKGVKDKGKMHYDLRIDNASPLDQWPGGPGCPQQGG